MSWPTWLARWGHPRPGPRRRDLIADRDALRRQLGAAQAAQLAAEREVVRLREVIVAQDRAAADRERLLGAAQMAVDAHAAQLRGSGELVDRYAGQLAAIGAVAANERLDDTQAMSRVRELLMAADPPPPGPGPGEPTCG